MRDLRLDELTHVYGGGGCNPQPSQNGPFLAGSRNETLARTLGRLHA
jgi:hypothetical protein